MDFQPARLRLARELREHSQADLARAVGVTPAAVSQFETGSTRPSTELTQRMAVALSMPGEFFDLPIVETHDGFFRSLHRTSVTHRRRARAIAHVAHDVAAAARPGQLPAISVPSLPVDGLNADRAEMEVAARRVRAEFGVPPGPIVDVVQILEEHGLVVIRLPLDTADVDAFSLPFNDRPVIVLGTDKNDRARSRFDAAHELGHLVAHGNQVWGVKEVEVQAHCFAAEFLMPEADIIGDLPSRADWPRLFELKQRWQVSLAALLMRARTLERMSEGQYLTAVKAASARGWRRTEPVPLGRPEQPARFLQLLSTTNCQRVVSALPQDILEALQSAAAA